MPNISEQITQLLEAVGGYGDIISTDLSTAGWRGRIGSVRLEYGQR
jgi:hypothetical protein